MCNNQIIEILLKNCKNDNGQVVFNLAVKEISLKTNMNEEEIMVIFDCIGNKNGVFTLWYHKMLFILSYAYENNLNMLIAIFKYILAKKSVTLTRIANYIGGSKFCFSFMCPCNVVPKGTQIPEDCTICELLTYHMFDTASLNLGSKHEKMVKYYKIEKLNGRFTKPAKK